MAKSDQLFKMPDGKSKDVSEAWPSPRTWEMATRAQTMGFIYDLSPQEISDSVSGFIGAGATGEFRTWCKHNDLPDPADFLDGLTPFTHNKTRLDRTAAVITSATSLVVQAAQHAKFGTPEAQLNTKRAEALWTFHKTLADQAPDLALGSVSALCKARMMIGSTTAYQVLATMEPVMSAAGITPGDSR